MRLAAMILAVVLISPGASWSQGLPGSRVLNSPKQADKSFFQEQQQKRQQQIRKPKQQPRPAPKGKPPVKKPASRKQQAR